MTRVESGRTQIVDATTARLWCIQEAAKKGFKPQDAWPDWMISGVERVRAGRVVNADWLAKKDAENSYI